MYVMPLMWSLSEHTLRWAGLSGEIKQSMVFMLYSSVVSTIIGLPWSLYSTFAVEQRHGFNKQVRGLRRVLRRCSVLGGSGVRVGLGDENHCGQSEGEFRSF